MPFVKRMAKRVAQTTLLQRAFEVIGYAVPRATTRQAIDDLFRVIGGLETHYSCDSPANSQTADPQRVWHMRQQIVGASEESGRVVAKTKVLA